MVGAVLLNPSIILSLTLAVDYRNWLMPTDLVLLFLWLVSTSSMAGALW